MDLEAKNMYENTYVKRLQEHASMFGFKKSMDSKTVRLSNNQTYLNDMNILFGEMTMRDSFFK